MFQKITYNLVFTSLVVALFFIAESAYRLYNPLLNFEFSMRLLGELFLTHFLLLSLGNKRVIYSIYTIFSVLLYVQFLHFSYYGGWIFPLEFYLFFSKNKEVLDTFINVLDIAIIPTTIWSLFSALLLLILRQFDAKRFTIPYLHVVLIVLIIFIPARVFFAHSKHGNRPSLNVNVVRNSIESIGYLLGAIIPRKLSPSKNLQSTLNQQPPVVSPNPDINVIFIIGESLSDSHMSMYGYKRDTTPNLNKLIGSENFYYSQAYSAGVCTDVSIPSMINIIEKPDGLPQIISTNTCLFALAKNNGFKTTFYSAQSSEGLKHIKGYLCMGSIDEVLDSTSAKKKQVDDNAYDEVLIERLEKVDFTQSNFLVLHQIGSHSPHEWRYPKAFEKFSSQESDSRMQKNINYYDNSVLYSDYVLSKIVNYIAKHSQKKTYVIFTSDHATMLDEKGVRGHGNLSHEAIYKVPFFVKVFNGDTHALDDFNGVKRVSHYEISHFIEKLLGYKVDKVIDDADGYYVCGQDLEGLDGYVHIRFDTNGTHKQIIMP